MIILLIIVGMVATASVTSLHLVLRHRERMAQLRWDWGVIETEEKKDSARRLLAIEKTEAMKEAVKGLTSYRIESQHDPRVDRLSGVITHMLEDLRK